jgi:hypothetical protein
MFVFKKSKCSQRKPLPQSMLQGVAEVKEAPVKKAPKVVETKPAPKKKVAAEEPVAENNEVKNEE